MFLKSHKWIMRPDAVSEIRREMNVREPSQNVMVWGKKAYNADTGKYDTDSIATINSYSLSQITKSGNYHPDARHISPDYRSDDDYSSVYNIPKFVPKDDDFNEECRQDEPKIIDMEAIKLEAESFQALIQMKLDEERENKLARDRVLKRSGDNFCNTIQNKWVPK
jgi:hypothetical protein